MNCSHLITKNNHVIKIVELHTRYKLILKTFKEHSQPVIIEMVGNTTKSKQYNCNEFDAYLRSRHPIGKYQDFEGKTDSLSI